MRIYVSYIYVSHITVCTVHTHTHIANKCLCTSPTYTHHTSQICITNIHHKYTSQIHNTHHHIHQTHTHSHIAQLREQYIILRRSSEHISLYNSSTRILLDLTQHIHTLFSGALANTYLSISLYISLYLSTSQTPAFSWSSHNTYIHYSKEVQRTHISEYTKYPHSLICHTTHTLILGRV